MKLQELVSTKHQTDHSLLEKMNIQSDAIVINQCDRDCIERFTFRGHDILWMSMNERGVGLSRNNAIIGTVQQEELTWLRGFDEKYFFDKGVLMKQCFDPWAKILLVTLLAKNGRQTQKMGLKNALECAFKGADSI